MGARCLFTDTDAALLPLPRGLARAARQVLRWHLDEHELAFRAEAERVADAAADDDDDDDDEGELPPWSMDPRSSRSLTGGFASSASGASSIGGGGAVAGAISGDWAEAELHRLFARLELARRRARVAKRSCERVRLEAAAELAPGEAPRPTEG